MIKRSKNVRTILTILAFMMSVVALCGCGGEAGGMVSKYGKNAEVHAAVVVGKHSNAKEIPLDSAAVRDLLYEASYTYGEVTFINCDAKPGVYGQFDIPEPEVMGLSENKKKTIAKGYASALSDMLGQAPVKTEECDYLAAIMKAANALNTNAENKVLLVLGSGLGTSDPLNFTKGYLKVDSADIVEALRAKKAIPDLTGVDVIWGFCGETAAPQEELSYEDMADLKEIWSAILLAGGANSVTFSNSAASDKAYEGLPFVTPVKPSDNSIRVEVPLQENREQEKIIETFVLDDSSVNFMGDSAEFVDSERAMESLSGLAQILKEHPDNQVYIVGTTATGKESYVQKLSQSRAEAVKEALISLGVSEEQMLPLGLGCSDYWHMADTDSNGHLIESIARLNRKVLILDTRSEDASHVTNG